LVAVTGTVRSSEVNARAMAGVTVFDSSGDGPGGMAAEPTFSPSANLSFAYGVLGSTKSNLAAGRTIANQISGYFRLDSATGGSGTVTNAEAIRIDSPYFNGIKPGTVYGLHVKNQGVAGITTNYGLYVDTPSGATNNYAAIFAGGNVGIGNTNPSNLLTMETSGGGYYNQSTHGWVNGSSGRWKGSIKPITGALDTVLKLNGVSFKWKKRTDNYETRKDRIEEYEEYVSSTWEDDPNGRDDIGLIGEDVGKVLPQVVDIDQKDPNFASGVAYSKIVALLIEAIKEQNGAIQDLKAQLAAIKSSIGK
jgi:hypothetical protein